MADELAGLLKRPVKIIDVPQETLQEKLALCQDDGSVQGVLKNLTGGELEIIREETQLDGDAQQTQSDDAPVIRIVNLLIAEAVERRASDIHIEPLEAELRIRYRIDGVLYEVDPPPKDLYWAIASRIKVMADLNIAERRLPQDGKVRMRLPGRELDLRISTVPTIWGESIVIRILDQASVLLGPQELGLSSGLLAQFKKLLALPHGMILVTGPTGSGKTTTLYAALSELNRSTKKIITIEDPVEYQLPGVNQIQVKTKIGLDFASGLRHILRQDPDIIMVGELRDPPAAQMAVRAALTGHLVFSTLHTNDAPSAVNRLVDLSVPRYLVSSTLRAVLAQRLVRVLCPRCKREYEPAGLPVKRAWQPVGCPECANIGYQGRTGIYELLLVDEEMSDFILAEHGTAQIKEEAQKKGFVSLKEDGWQKVASGITSAEELLRATEA
jgi:general secretion pathway protein E